MYTAEDPRLFSSVTAERGLPRQPVTSAAAWQRLPSFVCDNGDGEAEMMAQSALARRRNDWLQIHLKVIAHVPCGRAVWLVTCRNWIDLM